MTITINIYNNTTPTDQEETEQEETREVNIFDPATIEKNTLVSLFSTELLITDRSSVTTHFIQYLKDKYK